MEDARCVSTVTAFNLIHFACHDRATSLDARSQVRECGRSMQSSPPSLHAQPRRGEWDGARLRNSNVKCNNLLPLRGPNVPRQVYRDLIGRYFRAMSSQGAPLAGASLAPPDACAQCERLGPWRRSRSSSAAWCTM